MRTRTSARHRFLPHTRRQVRVALGALWLLDAGLQAQPHLFTADFWRIDLAQSVMGEPTGIQNSIFAVVDLVARHPFAWNLVFVAIQATIGMCLVTDRFVRPAIAASVPWALGIWWVGEGFGVLPTGFGLLAGGSPGPVLLYPLLGLLAWPQRDGETATDPPVTIRPALGAWAVLWAGQAILHLPWRYTGAQVLSANILENESGPRWLLALDGHVLNLVETHGNAIGVALALLEVLIGLAVFSDRTRPVALWSGIALMLVYWVVVQDFGQILGGNATDPSSGPLIVILGLALLGSSAREAARDPLGQKWAFTSRAPTRGALLTADRS